MSTPKPPQKGWSWKQARDLVIFLAGLGGFLHELIWGESERPFLLLMCAAMMGLPGLLALDEWRRGGGTGTPQ